MNAQHTPGRAFFDEDEALVLGEGRERIARCYRLFDSDTGKANARRLAACWNACEGLSTEKLEIAPVFDVAMAAKKHLDLVEFQRDELLAAVNGLLAYFESGNSVLISQATIKANSSEVLAARAAIAKAGGAA